MWMKRVCVFPCVYIFRLCPLSFNAFGVKRRVKNNTSIEVKWMCRNKKIESVSGFAKYFALTDMPNKVFYYYFDISTGEQSNRQTVHSPGKPNLRSSSAEEQKNA